MANSSILALFYPSTLLCLRAASLFGTDILTIDTQPALKARRGSLPARYPPVGAWPALMRADMAAAYLDYRDTRELARAVSRGEAPPPIGYHGIGRARQPVWSKAIIDDFAAPARAIAFDGSGENLASLV